MKVADLLNGLNDGKFRIKYNKWTFDLYDEFDILENDEKIALLRISADPDHKEIEYCRSYYNDADYPQDFNLCPQDFNTVKDFDDICNDIYDKYLLRDDAEFCAKLTGVDGKLYLPRYYSDISREDVMSDTWVYDKYGDLLDKDDHSVYDDDQMTEIRYGLEKGLNSETKKVSSNKKTANVNQITVKGGSIVNDSEIDANKDLVN